ncbi:hypothetical protein C2G38_2238956 [Gigaspora rosea]|uniref:F-box domain-containing protein n=1 Tax=Gigaspora rosea TaxID=44941 RepID=A0A397W3Y8_9GLOM|nr:hypothetical protein C2G38_2238956 [Gigaspora rosea]
MPELMVNILNNLNDKLYSLYSCALVSRHWCKISIPILWRDPFSSLNQNPLFITRYLSSLGEDEKFVLRECGINKEFPKTQFDYARFLKVLCIGYLVDKVKKWIDLESVNSNPYCDISNSVINLLLKLFIESGATIDKLAITFPNSLKLKPEIFCSLEQNKQFFSRLRQLYLAEITSSNIESAIKLLRTVANHTIKIRILKLYQFISDYEPQIYHAIIYIIKSQEQIRLFSIVGEEYLTEFHGIIAALESQKNSLQEIIMFNFDYNIEFEVLNNCKNLEILRIKYCNKGLPKLSKLLDYKIGTLEIVGCPIDGKPIALMLEKSGTLLQRLILESNDKIQEESLLLGALKSCPNITYLSIQGIVFSPQLVKRIGDLQKLQFLSLWCDDVDDIPEEVLKIRVMQFSEILPSTLQYFNLGDTWLEPYTDVLFNHCNAPLKKILIYRLKNEKISKALVEFCMRNKTLNYLGVFNYLDLDDNTRKEVEAHVELVRYEDIIVNC